MLRLFFVVLSAFFALAASAQQLPGNSRVGKVSVTRASVGTTSQAALAVAPGGNMLKWEVCNDATNTSTHLFVGMASDAATDGVMLGKGQCFVCPYCTPKTLSEMRVKGQASSNGYTVVQYRQ